MVRGLWLTRRRGRWCVVSVVPGHYTCTVECLSLRQALAYYTRTVWRAITKAKPQQPDRHYWEEQREAMAQRAHDQEDVWLTTR